MGPWSPEEPGRCGSTLGPARPIGAWFHHGALLVLHWHQEFRGCGPMWQPTPWGVTSTVTPRSPFPPGSPHQVPPAWNIVPVSSRGHQGVPFIPQ